MNGLTKGISAAVLTGVLMLGTVSAFAQATATKAPETASQAAPQVSGDDDGPISTKGKRITAQILPVPHIEDAPADDFDRVAWCHGALAGHMDIAERIGDDDQEIRAIGKAYLKTYEAALTLSEAGKTKDGHKRASDWQKKGFEQWNVVRAASKDKQGGAYMNWMLPADCEKAAGRLSGRPNLFAEMQDEKTAALIGETLKRGPQPVTKTKAKKN